jgi:hypothetical protein
MEYYLTLLIIKIIIVLTLTIIIKIINRIIKIIHWFNCIGGYHIKYGKMLIKLINNIWKLLDLKIEIRQVIGIIEFIENGW